MHHGHFGPGVGEVFVELVVRGASRNALLHQPVLEVLPEQLVQLQLMIVIREGESRRRKAGGPKLYRKTICVRPG